MRTSTAPNTVKEIGMGKLPSIKAQKTQSRASKFVWSHTYFFYWQSVSNREFWSIAGCLVFRYIMVWRSTTIDKFHLMSHTHIIVKECTIPEEESNERKAKKAWEAGTLYFINGTTL